MNRTFVILDGGDVNAVHLAAASGVGEAVVGVVGRHAAAGRQRVRRLLAKNTRKRLCQA